MAPITNPVQQETLARDFPREAPYCDTLDPETRYVCTRRQGHQGYHVALAGRLAVAAWVEPSDSKSKEHVTTMTKVQQHAAWKKVQDALTNPNFGICQVLSDQIGTETERTILRCQLARFKPEKSPDEPFWWPRTPAGLAIRKAIVACLIEETSESVISNETHAGKRVTYMGEAHLVLSPGAAMAIKRGWDYSQDNHVAVVNLRNGSVFIVLAEKLEPIK